MDGVGVVRGQGTGGLNGGRGPGRAVRKERGAWMEQRGAVTGRGSGGGQGEGIVGWGRSPGGQSGRRRGVGWGGRGSRSCRDRERGGLDGA